MIHPARVHVLNTFEKLMQLIPEADRTKPQIVILAGGVTPYRNDTDREMPFRQESNFYYLSGCDVPGSYLLLVYQAGTYLSSAPAIELYIPEIQLADLMWSIPPPSIAEASQLYETTRLAYVPALTDAIVTYQKAFPDAIFHTLPIGSPLFPELKGDFTQLKLSPTDAFLLSALHQARLIKTEYEITQIRKANEISSRAHEVVMRTLGRAVRGLIKREPGAAIERPLLPGEWLIEKEAEAEAIFVASCRREGSVQQAYLPIVAASTRAATLHYCCNDKEFAWGPVAPHDHHNNGSFVNGHAKDLQPQVLLIDAGCEWNCYASDITRTMPVGNGGKFTPEARAIYELVLEMQKVSLEILKPGLHWDAVQLLCHRTLVKGFQKLGIFLSPESPNSGSWNSEEAILASGVSAAFFPHGVGHSLGLDVHDVPSASRPAVNNTIGKGKDLRCPDFYTYLRLRLPLQERMVVTVEPGIYFHPHLLAPIRSSRHIDHAVLARYEAVGGVRIEDVVLITADGHENITTVGKETSWIEGVCSGEL
ncbi:prolidase [Fomitiporia mediterranea MF3/22]|uniref:prolidase n=1 Tax=Fomitiporia mediterranea (strain MF3/22) TaxID=694068 RepID=UPI00044094A7|nr:prolidase [Fomitiporia mediterranea MF3/22]EJD00492.1 prolidase [Fomitiporia mediterranea MF3/22]